MRDFFCCAMMDDWLSQLRSDTEATSITLEGSRPGWIDLQNVFSMGALEWNIIKQGSSNLYFPWLSQSSTIPLLLRVR